jgi:hypothetical protein
MLYVGFAITIEEAIRLFKLDANIVKSFYDTEPIETYLKEKQSELVFTYIDKGACLLGIPIHLEDTTTHFPYSKAEDTILSILIAKKQFLKEIQSLSIDIRNVNLTWIEEEEICVENPEPYVMNV